MKKMLYIIPIIALTIAFVVYFKISKDNNRNIPDEVIIPSPNMIAIEPETGVKYVKGEIIIGFTNNTDEAKAVGIIKNAGGIAIGRDKRINQYQIRVDSKNLSEIRKIIEILKQNPNVEFAVPNFEGMVEY